MIRNAGAKLLLAPGIRRQRRQIYAAGAAISGAGVTVLTSTCYLSTPKQTSAQHVLATSPPSSSNNSNSLPASAPAGLIVPTLQASVRAVNLIATVCAMVMDYELAKVQRSLLSGTPDSLLLPLGLIGPQTAEDEQMLQLEDEVAKCRDDLESAQAEYTGKGDENAARRQEKQIDHRQRVRDTAERLANAEAKLAACGGDLAGRTHRKAANRLLKLCRENKGVYIKIGQHLANLDYLVPEEYIACLSSLFDDAPDTSIDDVREVVREDLGRYPEELWSDFDPQPIASASLAQVHVAFDRITSEKLAIKVQHRGLRETSRGDIMALQLVVKALERLFPEEFCYGWIMEEIAPQLPKELDFRNEGKNSERAARHLADAKINCVVPKVHWDCTTDRVLTMTFEEGFRSTDVDAIQRAGLKKYDVAKLISSVFNSQALLSGFVHCDPHPANVLLRSDQNGKPQLVLVDHGLYKQLDDDFRLNYARLWRALMLADIPQIQTACSSLGIGKMYPLLAAMLTSRPFDEIVERSQSGALDASSGGSGAGGDKAMIRGYAQKFIADIIALIDAVPRQMLLLFKMNDCLRHIDHALDSPTNTLVNSGSYAARAVHEAEMRGESGDTSNNKVVVKSRRLDLQRRIQSWLSYKKLMAKISLYEWMCWVRQRRSN